MKIKFDKLPDGFDIVNDQIVEIKQSGGSTGDQKNYGLYTGPSEQSRDEDIQVNYSMSAVPRDEANLEAEGGETVLTDLNNNGKFNLFDIKGPRHSSGGVPLNLPGQSFVFSDFSKMKLTKEEMKEMGVDSKKRMTPAKVSKKYGTNEYYAAMKDPFADDIQARSAEMMLEKNKEKLSKLSFIQENKKDFEEGVPVTSYPYLVSQGEDPIAFTQKVEQINRQKAEEKYIRSLPMEQQMQIMALQEYMAQVDQQQEDEDQVAIQTGQLPKSVPGKDMMPPPPEMDNQQLAKMGYEIIAQKGYEVDKQAIIDQLNSQELLKNRNYNNTIVKPIMEALDNLDVNDEAAVRRLAKELYNYGLTGLIKEVDAQNDVAEVEERPQGVDWRSIANDGMNILSTAANAVKDKFKQDLALEMKRREEEKKNLGRYSTSDVIRNAQEANEVLDNIDEVDDEIPTVLIPDEEFDNKPKKSKRPTRKKTNVAYSADWYDDFYKDRNVVFSPATIGEGEYADVQAQEEIGYGGAAENLEGFYEDWKDKYDRIDQLKEELDRTKGQGTSEEVAKFQKWFNDDYLLFWAKDWAERYAADNYEGGASPDDIKRLRLGMYQKLRSDIGFNPNEYGKAFDKKFGTFTSSRRPLLYAEKAKEIMDIPMAQEYTEDGKPVEKTEKLNPGQFKVPYNPNDPRFWLQDLLKLNAIANRKRDKFYPWEPAVEDIDVDYVLEDPTRAIAATNEQMNLLAQGLGSFSGPQSYNSRMSNIQAKTAANIANVIAGVHNRNINTVNKGLAQQAQFDYYIDKENRDRQSKLYDDTMRVEENALTEQNFDREQYAEALSNAYTNMANTYNMNSLYDNYGIDPTTGGMVYFTNPNALKPSRDNTLSKLDRYRDFIFDFQSKFNRGPKDYELKYFMDMQTDSNMNNYQQEASNNQALMKGYDALSMGRRGRETRKLLPFFTGQIGI